MGKPVKQTAAVLNDAYGMPHTIDEQYPVPHPGPGEALIQLEASGICHGDLNPRDGHPPAAPEPIRPLVTGHEGIGHIIELGEGCTEYEVGDRVGMGWRYSTCHECKQCQMGLENLCPSLLINGYTQDGTFQEYMKAATSDLIRIPTNNVPASHLAPLLCAGGTALAAVRSSEVRKGEWLCVVGAAGGVGSLAVQYGKYLGYRVIAIDTLQKRNHCEQSGADFFINYEDADTVVPHVKDVTGVGVQGTVICSTNSASYSQAAEYSAIGATIVSVGPTMVHLHTGLLMVKGIKLISQCNASKRCIEDALALSSKGIVPAVEVVALKSLDEALNKLQASQVSGRQVIVFR